MCSIPVVSEERVNVGELNYSRSERGTSERR